MSQNEIGSNQIFFKQSSITRVLVAVAVFLIVASIGGQLIRYLTSFDFPETFIRLFFLGYEQNCPTYFISSLELFSALLLLLISVQERKRKSANVLRWTGLSLVFFYIALDEMITIHEYMTTPVSNLLGGGKLGIFNFAWVIPGFVILVILAVFFFRFLLQLDAKTRLTFVIAATLMIGGAFGLELIGGGYSDVHGEDNLTYRMLQNVEESMEMVGVIVFVRGLLVYISDNFKTIQFNFSSASG
jgi:hypothetical protein